MGVGFPLPGLPILSATFMDINLSISQGIEIVVFFCSLGFASLLFVNEVVHLGQYMVMCKVAGIRGSTSEFKGHEKVRSFFS